jgi:hypothetical protein
MILDINNSFIDRKAEGADIFQIERISRAYQKWKETQVNSRNEYQVSREWLPIYSDYMGPVINAHQASDFSTLKKMYENFFRESLSTGLHGIDFDMVDKFMNPLKIPKKEDIDSYIRAISLYLNNFFLNCRDTKIECLARPPVGNPYGYRLEGFDIFPCAEYHFYYAKKIGPLLGGYQSPIVLELGGGFGGMAYYLMRDFKNIKYIGVDLPENAALQAYYLISHFPDLKIKLFGEDPQVIGDDYDIYILPNYAIESLDTNSVNLSFNSYSLAEMGLDAINNYINILCRVTKDFILHLNHVYWEVSSDHFPVDMNKFQLLFRNPTMWGKDPNNYKLDHHEFFYIAK